ncbi:activating signal cointegrator 1 complex subunit 1 isoform X1 [Canis lupus baileyi]|nr:activating signal cointegrator 1 complex subunit 1 isoform X1 [Canis lupus dingo]XP_038347019.1 activating signal cointegrator 1 complex subunit 1 isoform X1 [Canis lupus familiaris]XP_038390203.1 activating signal cointegrator 1 complex subunit 1 isoform X1 [Canis lupus familiaris]XP_038518790.1 activating signal cointegrator 1 complex subunit 1 isoform X1 [Canis lupus familiaris]
MIQGFTFPHDIEGPLLSALSRLPRSRVTRVSPPSFRQSRRPGALRERQDFTRILFKESIMEVLRPQLVRIGGRIYRKNPIQEQTYQHEEEDEDFYQGFVECAEDPCDAYEVVQTQQGFRCTVKAPSLLYKHIVGKRGDTRKKLEVETKTSISIPKPGQEGEIVITGQHRSGVISARTRIDVLLLTFRRKQPFTHFLAFFLNEAEVQERFLKFQEEVLEKCSMDHGVDSTIFQNPKKLHLTIGMLVLLSEQEIQQTCEMLQQCKEEFIDDISGGKPLEVEMAGIEYMNDDPGMVDVLYAKVHMKDGSNRLQELVDRVLERFQASGLIVKEWNSVKLHATVMNTLFRKDPNAEGRYNLYTADGKYIFKERESFDGRNILKLFENFYFGTLKLNSIHISQRFTVDSFGNYASCGQIDFS